MALLLIQAHPLYINYSTIFYLAIHFLENMFLQSVEVKQLSLLLRTLRALRAHRDQEKPVRLASKLCRTLPKHAQRLFLLAN